MANYNVRYACGHGSVEKQLFGKHVERERKITWMESNMVCPECYKAQMKAKDAAAPATAKICLVPGSRPVISIEVAGQIDAHKEALYAAGYRWSDSSKDGLFGYFSTSRPQRALALLCEAESEEQVKGWLLSQQKALEAIGYKITEVMNVLDQSYLQKLIAEKTSTKNAKEEAKAKLEEIKKTDPKPATSLLRVRIHEIEKESKTEWNGKIYGRSGRYNFYVNNVKYDATDHEVLEREDINKKRDAWDAKYKDLICAAK